MIINLVVGSALVLAAGFSCLWLIYPGLRERIERPKYQFLDYTRGLDEISHGDDGHGSGHESGHE